MVQLIINGHTVDLDIAITYNFQVGEIGEISLSKSSYTSSFELPRTSEIRALFKGLGDAGDTSRIPYVINSVILMEDYITLMEGSLVVLTTTPEAYKVTVISGSFDFFSELGDTRLSDIDISEIQHEKTLNEVYNRLQRTIIVDDLVYAFAYTGGMTHYTSDGGPITVNIDNLIPFVRAKYVWDAIFRAYPRFTFSGSFYDSSDFRSLFISLPYAMLGEAGEAKRKLTLSKTSYSFGAFPSLSPVLPTYDDFNYLVLDGPLSTTVNVLKDGLYRISIKRFFTSTITTSPANQPIRISLYKDGGTSPILSVDNTTNSEDFDLGSIEVYANAGEYFWFMFTTTAGTSVFSGTIHDLTIEMSVVTAEMGGGAFDIALRDLVKEIMWRYGLVAFVKGNHIHFEHLNSILISEDVVDWSSKYAGRSEEEYTLNYAQSNELAYSGEDNWANRLIPVDNRNLPAHKEMLKSKLFPGSQFPRPYRTNATNVISATDFITFDADNKLLKRYHFARISSQEIPYRIGSASMGGFIEFTPDPILKNGPYIANFNNLSFADNPYYSDLHRVLTDTRAHKIYLKLDLVDINQLDLKKLYYFEQEQAFYMINSLRFVTGSLATGEFIKVR